MFALANPDPEVDPFAASKHAAIVATGRSDYPNQINNVLAFPGFFRGMLDSGAHEITDECLLAAATAIADCVAPGELNANYIVPVGVRPRRRARRGRRGPQSHHLTNQLNHINHRVRPGNQPGVGMRKELRAVTSSETTNPGPGPGDRRADPAGAGRTADLR